jgi:hypothetical protein
VAVVQEKAVPHKLQEITVEIPVYQDPDLLQSLVWVEVVAVQGLLPDLQEVQVAVVEHQGVIHLLQVDSVLVVKEIMAAQVQVVPAVQVAL